MSHGSPARCAEHVQCSSAAVSVDGEAGMVSSELDEEAAAGDKMLSAEENEVEVDKCKR